MPLWSRRKDRTPITASGRVIDLHDRETIATLSATRMAWQSLAWNYRNSIGELGGALRMKGQLIAKVQFTAAAVVPDADEPKVLTGEPDQDKDEDGHPYVDERIAAAAVDCAQRLPWEDGYGFIGRMVQGFDVAGECWLHMRKDQFGDERWTVRSTSEVVPSVGGGLGIIEVPGRGAREVKPDSGEVLIRLWVPHPEYDELADSALRALLDVCEEIVLAGREIRAASLSRIASNGILFIPSGCSMVRDGEPTATPENDSFLSGFTTAATQPINNEGHPSAVVPILIQGDAEDGKEIRHIPFVRETDDELMNRLSRNLDRVGDSIDLPSQAMRGIQDANHWTAWLIDAQAFKNHLEPTCRLIVDSLTNSWFRRMLMLSVDDGGYGLTKEEAKSVRLWYAAGNLTENANRSQDADQAMDRGAISFKAYRTAKGFGEDDAPQEEDLQQIMMIKATRPDPNTLTQIAAELLGVKAIIPNNDRILDSNGNPIQPPAAPGTPPVITSAPVKQVGPGQAAPPQGTPQAAPPGARVASAADPQGVLDSVKIITGDRLADLDHDLIERIRATAEADLQRALEKAGAKIKAQVQGRKFTALAAELKDVPPALAGRTLGQVRVTELGLTEDVLLTLAFSYLASKFAQWSAATIKASVKTVAGMVGLPLTAVAALTQAMTDRIPAAWKKLEGTLRSRATDAMYGRHGDQLRGEVPDSVILPGDIREALAEIGGPHAGPGGIALGGDLLRAVDTHAERIGFTWRYGITPRSNAFEPHLNLAGRKFEGFEDPALISPPAAEWVGTHLKPGDHAGCMCDTVYAWALDDADDIALMADLPDSPAAHSDRVLAGLDEAAGRTGTWSQRTTAERDRIVEVQRAWIERRAPR